MEFDEKKKEIYIYIYIYGELLEFTVFKIAVKNGPADLLRPKTQSAQQFGPRLCHASATGPPRSGAGVGDGMLKGAGDSPT